MRVPILVLAILLAGCADAPEPAQAPEPEVGAQPVLSAPVNESIALPEVELLTSLREFHWATADTADAMVVRIRVDFGTANDCNIGGGRAGQVVNGPNHIFLREREDGTGISTSSSGELAHVQAGPVDTRGESRGGHSAGTSSSGGAVSGPATLTLGGRALRPWDSSIMSDASLAISIACAKPFDIVDAHWSPEFHAWDSNNMVGAASAGISVGSATAGGADAVELTGGYGRIMTGGSGYQVGRITITSDQDRAGGAPCNKLSLEAGPGTYGFEADQAGIGSCWVAAYSLHEPLDISLGMRDDSAMPRFDST